MIFFLHSTAKGCQTNLYDTALIRNMIAANGHKVSSNYQKSDFVIVNTCGFNQKQEDESISAIKFYSQSMQQKVIVYGCLEKINLERIKNNFNGPLLEWQIIGNKEFAKFEQIFNLQGKKQDAIVSHIDKNDLSQIRTENKFLLAFNYLYFRFKSTEEQKSGLLTNILLSAALNTSFYIRDFQFLTIFSPPRLLVLQR